MLINMYRATLSPPSPPLTQAPESSETCVDGQAKADFTAEGVVPADMKSVYEAWMSWMKQEDARGKFSHPDAVNAPQLNRFDWYSAHDWKVAYPGDPKIYVPDQVPGRKLPAAFIGN